MWKFDEFWEIITLDLMRADIGEISQNSLQEYLKVKVTLKFFPI